MLRLSIKQISIAGSFWLIAISACAQLKISTAYYSPRNKERDVRSKTTLLILHTTEAPSVSALRKLSDMGECHYCIDEAGRIYSVIDPRRVAFHTGRSMWNGKQEVENFSIGIEVCGYHNKPLNTAQTKSLKDLIAYIKSAYKLSDTQVLPHSQVAFGAPNKWQLKNHRGRKRCGMLFAMPSIRSKLGLKSRPSKDPDVAAKRLVIADPALNEVLYGNMNAFTAPSPQDYEPQQPLPVFNKATTPARSASGYQTIGLKMRAQDIAGRAVRLASTIYVYPNGRYAQGHQLTAEAILKLPYGTKVLLDYSVAGSVSSQRSPITICGSRWKLTTTYYLINGALFPGNMVDDGKIPAGTTIFTRND
jgi:N-acetyl-anhydromuramyl-L-alanine amidase AmpD